MHGQPWMRRFDFDTEAVVRLAWRGVKPVNLAAPVKYLTPEEGGVSHFKYGRDNVLLTWMHARLMVEFVLRLPSLCAAPARRASALHAGALMAARRALGRLALRAAFGGVDAAAQDTRALAAALAARAAAVRAAGHEGDRGRARRPQRRRSRRRRAGAERQKARPDDDDIEDGQRPILLLVRRADGTLGSRHATMRRPTARPAAA